MVTVYDFKASMKVEGEESKEADVANTTENKMGNGSLSGYLSDIFQILI